MGVITAIANSVAGEGGIAMWVSTMTPGAG